jgi:hypothetical protein
LFYCSIEYCFFFLHFCFLFPKIQRNLHHKMSNDDRIERSRLARKVCAVAAAACALGLTSLVVRHDGSYLPSALSQFYGPGGLTEAGPVTAGAEAGARQVCLAYKRNMRKAVFGMLFIMKCMAWLQFDFCDCS